MRSLERRPKRAVIAGFSILIAACGGSRGGGGYMSAPMPPPPAAPTVSVTAPAAATTINFGQAVTVSWTSMNATSCTASASDAAAGAFAGSQAASGSMMVAPTAAGSYTYSLSCMGSGGSMSASSAMVTVSPSILAMLAAAPITTIGPVTAGNGDDNPYGLALAPATAGLITKGDLVVCNFNDAGQTEGNGTTIVGLHPQSGSMPYPIAQSAMLEGCNALAVLGDDSIAAAAWTAQSSPLVASNGTLNTPFSNAAITAPWGEAYVPAQGSSAAALYISNAPGGSSYAGAGNVVRVMLNADAPTSITEIAKGFCTGGAPGGIYGPAGLTYDASSDTLYVIDTASNSVIALSKVSNIGTDGVTVEGQRTAVTLPAATAMPAFSGASASSARVIAHGAPLNTPLSATLLADGDLLVGNADIGPTQTNVPSINLMIEVSPWLPGGFVGQPFQADATTSGALFGIVATVDPAGKQIVYFNDDNSNAVMQIGPP
ncbi:MAG TPA: hypothetical protein VGI93_15495 [Steroidobacteraceae bacterium]